MQLIKSRKVAFICIFSALSVGTDKAKYSWGPFKLPSAVRCILSRGSSQSWVSSWYGFVIMSQYSLYTFFKVLVHYLNLSSEGIGQGLLLVSKMLLCLLYLLTRENTSLWHLHFACKLYQHLDSWADSPENTENSSTKVWCRTQINKLLDFS